MRTVRASQALSMRALLSTLILLLAPIIAARADTGLFGNLGGFNYPYPVIQYPLKTQAQNYAMAYMDIAADAASGAAKPPVVLLHGPEYCGAMWESAIKALHGAGYRVVVPDQIGTCKSSKPVNYQYSFQQLAVNTRSLLDSLKIGRVILVGHSMGGMLAMRYALMYPDELAHLVLVDPLGLEDWKAKGVLYRTIDERYAIDLQSTVASLRRYQQENYFANRWQPQFDQSLQALAGQYSGSGRERFVWNQALILDMIFTQPVVDELERIRVPTLLMIGDKDHAMPFGDSAPPQVAAQLGNYPELGRRAAKRIPGARLVEFAELGHVPQLESPERFNETLLQGIATAGAGGSGAPAPQTPPSAKAPGASAP